MIESNLNINWDCLTRANLVSDELLIKMKNAGCKKIDMGVESGSDKILLDTKKGVNKKQILKGANLVKKHKIMLYMFFMIGLPTETEDDVKETKKFLKLLKPDWAGISIFTPIPGTEIYNELIEIRILLMKNLILQNFRIKVLIQILHSVWELGMISQLLLKKRLNLYKITMVVWEI